MAAYADDGPVREARARYFEANGFAADGGYDDDWVRLKLGPIPLAFPNTPSRKAAVPMHDLHHIATGYDTDLAGEAQIGAWEIASGCWQVRAAWVLNMLVQFPILLFRMPRIHRAFVRGRHSTNLYGASGEPAAGLLEGNVGELRARLDLDVATPPASVGDELAFVRFVVTVLAIQVGIAFVLFGIPAWWLGAFA